MISKAILASNPPGQLGIVTAGGLAEANGGGAYILCSPVVTHPPVSVIVTVYVPGPILAFTCPMALFDQTYVSMGSLPGTALTVMAPFISVAHNTPMVSKPIISGALGGITVPNASTVQPLSSVTVTV